MNDLLRTLFLPLSLQYFQLINVVSSKNGSTVTNPLQDFEFQADAVYFYFSTSFWLGDSETWSLWCNGSINTSALLTWIVVGKEFVLDQSILQHLVAALVYSTWPYIISVFINDLRTTLKSLKTPCCSPKMIFFFNFQYWRYSILIRLILKMFAPNKNSLSSV